MANLTKTLQDIVGIKFTWYDYSFFSSILLVSIIIGIYYGFYKKQQTESDYLLGGKSMGTIPIACSLSSAYISGIPMLAIPSEVYRYGIAYWFTYVDIVCIIFFSYKVFVPVFIKLQTTSVFGYLKLRFDTKTRLLGSMIHVIASLLYLPVAIYVTALGLAESTGMDLHLISALICAICIFYTSMGGLKAVVYSDIFQLIVMVGSVIFVFILGVVRCGGIEQIWTTCYESDRLTLSLDIDFIQRNGFWAVTIGQFILWVRLLGTHQVFIQKCLAVPSNKEVTKVLIIFAVIIFIFGSLCNFIGLNMYTEYSDCDPLKAGILQKQDQLLPYYIMDISRQLPGLAGFYIAGIFSATLSTMASVLNGLSCTIYNDFVSRYLRKDISQRKITTILKLLVVIIGVISTAMIFIIENLGGMLALSISLGGVTSGPILALFVAGMLIPSINAKGAYYGSLVSMLTMSIVVFGSEWYKSTGLIVMPSLPVSIDGCPNLNFTTFGSNNQHMYRSTLTTTSDNVPYIFKVTIYWYACIGMIVSITFGLIISAFTKDKKRVNKDLLSPIIYPLLSRKDDETVHVSENLLEHHSKKNLDVSETEENKS